MSFAPYETSKTVTVALTPVGVDDLGGQFSLVLSNASAGSILTGRATATITAAADPPPAPTTASPAASSGTLAWTGTDTRTLVLVGFALVLAGAFLTLTTRRRHAG